MLTDHFERFMRLERRSIPDNLGSEEVSWQPVGHFLGALTHHSGHEISAGGRAALRLTPSSCDARKLSMRWPASSVVACRIFGSIGTLLFGCVVFFVQPQVVDAA